jgi:hypothetical protein
MVDEMMVTAERALLAKTAERGWTAEQAATRRGRARFSVNHLRDSIGVVRPRAGGWLRGVTGVTPAGVLLACRMASPK